MPYYPKKNPLFKYKFGCEFEYSTPWQQTLDMVKPIIKKVYGSNCINANNSYFESINNKKWDLKLDGTTECELCTPVSKYSDLTKICKVIGSLDTKITESDSLHVHVDCGKIEKYAILAGWLKYEDVIFHLFPEHRRKNDSYCAKLIEKGKKQDLIAQFFENAVKECESHYTALSFSQTKRTIEFRIAEGTKDPVFVYAWVNFLLYFVEYCSKLDPTVAICKHIKEPNLQQMISDLNIYDPKVIEWLEARRSKFRKKSKKIS